MSRAGAPWVLVACLAAIWWGTLLHQTESSVFGQVPLLDERHYLEEAAMIDGPEEDTPRAHFMSPLYPRILVFTGAALSPDQVALNPATLRGLRILQGILWVAAALLLRGVAGRLLPGAPPAWVWLPSLLFLLYAPLAVYAQMVLVAAPLVFLVVLWLWLLTWPRLSWLVFLGLGLTLGLAGLLRGSLLVLAPLTLLWLGVAGDREIPARRRFLIPALLFLLALAMVLAPPAIHNARISGRLSPPTLNGGLNLYLGMGPDATGLGSSFAGDWQEDPAGLVPLTRILGRPATDLGDADRQWSRLAREAMAESPGRALGLWLRKMHLQIQGWEMDQITTLRGWREEIPGLRFQMVPWALLTALAGAGLVTARGRVILPVAALLLLMSAQSFFFVVSRYRMVLVPLLCLLAVVGARQLVMSRGRTVIGPALGVLVAALLTLPWGLGEERERWAGLALANHAQRYALLESHTKEGTARDRARRYYQRAVEAYPDQPEAWLAQAALSGEGQPGVETRYAVLEQGVDQVSDPVPLLRALVAAALTATDLGKAEEAALRLLEHQPDDAETLHNLAVLLAGRGDLDGALEQARLLRQWHPDQAQGYLDEGVLLARRGDGVGAAEVLETGQRRFPADERFAENLRRLASRKNF